MPTQPITGPGGIEGPQGPSPSGTPGPLRGGQPPETERTFGEILKDSLDHVNHLQEDADLSVEKLYRGEASLDEVMVAFKKAQLSFETLMQIRNKLVDAFEELQRMRI